MSQQLKIKVSDKAEGVIEKDVENKVLNRREITIKIYHIGSGTPSRKEIISAISAVLGAKEDLIVIKRVDTVYGAGISIVRANVYKNKEDLEKVEPKHLIGRDTGQKVKKGGGKGAAKQQG